MPDARLLALVWPDLRLPDADTAPFEPMLDALDDLSPRIEAVAVGVALIDVTGLGPLFGSERRIAARAVALAREVASLTARAGVGGNRWLAVLAARLAGSDDGCRVLDRGALADLPLSLLPADSATRQRFALFGLTTMGQLAALPRSAVGSQFGAIGERLQQLARGNDPRPLVPRRRPERLTAERTFETPLSDVGAAGLALRALVTELVDQLRDRQLAPGRAGLRLSREDASPLRIELAFPQPALEPDWIARLLLSRLEAAARQLRPYANTAPADAATVPNSNQDRLRRPDRSNPGAMPAQNLRKPIPLRAPNTDSRGLIPAKPSVVEVWQADDETNQVGRWRNFESGTEDESEPRITGIGLAFDRLSDPQSRQLAAFEPQAGRWEELRWALERVHARFGDGRLWRAEHVRPNASRAEERARLRDIGP
jgi:nucleotidyltransferase/DNA polymerase involved in DNA repair